MSHVVRRSRQATRTVLTLVPPLLGCWAQAWTWRAAQAQGVAADSAAATASPISVLLEQANYWHQQGRDEQALEALRRALLLDPTNADALYQSALLQAELGRRPAAQATLTQLRAVRPDDPRILQVEQALRIGAIDNAGLAEARNLAQSGRSAEAIARYNALFQGSPPPDSLAAEYYQVLSSTDNGWDGARDGLARYVVRNPGDTRAQLAYARLLTYRPTTRADGISRLAILANNPATSANARTAWRQALDWLPVDSTSIPLYQSYLARYPDDPGLTQRLADARNPRRTPADEAGLDRQRGFDALQANRLGDAEAAFQAALKVNTQDADALGGLGLVRQRQGRIADARDLLERAIAAAPDKAAQWQPALNGLTAAAELASARAQIRSGEFSAAAQQLRALIARGGDTTEAQVMLADVMARSGDAAGAEAGYRAVLSRRPEDPAALIGLANILSRRGQTDEAEALLARAASTSNGKSAQLLRAQLLRQQAAKLDDADAAIGLLREAVAAAPSDPWARLDLARALAHRGNRIEAQALMEAVTDTSRPSPGALHAAALFALEQNHPDQAAALAARIPPSSRSPDMNRLLEAAQFRQQVHQIVANSYFTGNARQQLLALAAAPDPDGTRGAAIIKAFATLGDPAGARQAVAVELALNRKPSVAARLAYAGALLAAGLSTDAGSLVASIDVQGGLTAQQQAELTQLRDGIAVQSADRLNQAGQTAEAYDQLAPALQQSPDNADLNLALGRLYQSSREPKQALAIAQAVLRRDPNNLDARRAAVGAAIALGELRTADQLVQDGMAASPDDPRTWMMSADLAQARGNYGATLRDLRTAQALRQQQIGVVPPTPPAARTAPIGGTRGLAVGGNPFRAGGAPPPLRLGEADGIMPGTPAGPMLPSDPLSADIAQAIAVAQAATAPDVRVAPTYRTRSGTSGLDQLNELTVPLQASFSPGGYGRMTATITPTLLANGSLSSATTAQQQFGTVVFGGPPPGNQTAQGVGLSAAYAYRWLAVDVGSSPLGFRTTNVLGGVELSPEVVPGLRVRATAQRRAVTDSLLSYAGTIDSGTGQTFGGVVQNRAHSQLEFSAGLANFYLGGGYSQLSGQNVKTNTKTEAGGGGAYPVYRNGGSELRVGLDLVYFSYADNLRYFTFGQGGYFSPQSYFAALIPVNFTQKLQDLTWSLGGSIGVQSYTEHDSPVFPNNPNLQAQLVRFAAGNSSIVTTYPGKSQSGVIGNAHGTIEYQANPSLRIGGLLRYDRAGDWNELSASVFARYIFNQSP